MIMWGMCILYVLFDGNSSLLPSCWVKKVPVRMKCSDTDEVAVNILKVDHQIITAGLPNLTLIKGLDPQRQWYLYEHIRLFCKSNLSADCTCPQPSCPKPGQIELSTQSTSTPNNISMIVQSCMYLAIFLQSSVYMYYCTMHEQKENSKLTVKYSFRKATKPDYVH